jgi:hypothetical protein
VHTIHVLIKQASHKLEYSTPQNDLQSIQFLLLIAPEIVIYWK